MGVRIKEYGEVQPICDDCGVALCWSIDESEYLEWKGFWESWKCRDCNANYKGAYEDYQNNNEPFKELKAILNDG